MASVTSPTLLRRRLAFDLRRLRESAELQGVDVARRLGWSTSKISRMENGQALPSRSDVARLLELYGVASPLTELLLGVAEGGQLKGWWEPYADVLGGKVIDLVGMEAGAGRIRTWQSMLVPGLLQTREYAMAVIGNYDAIERASPAKMRRRTDFRMRRQERLTSPDVECHTILDEAVLLRRFGDEETMRGQLRHLLKLGELPNVRIQVFPLRTPHPVDWSNFVLLGFPEAAGLGPIYGDVVYTENFPSSVLAEDEETPFLHGLAFGWLAEAALDENASREWITSLL